jgi:carbon-monoxide dehydrogenase medium subunit
MAPTPVVADLGVAAPNGPGGAASSWADAAARAVADLDPDSDIHATAAYRLQLARVLTARALAAAWSASEGPRRQGFAA